MASYIDFCSSERLVSLRPNDFCSIAGRRKEVPVDEFLTQLRALLPLATPESLVTHPALGRLLLLGVVSVSEHYFRSTIGRLVHICPLAWHHASNMPMTLGSVDYYGVEQLALGLLESITFSSPSMIITNTERLIGVKPKGTSMEKAIKDFERICQLRHAAVHSDGHLNSKNLRDFDLPGMTSAQALKIDYDGFQTIVAICENAVRAYNRSLFATMCDRWRDKKVLTNVWRKDKKKYTELFGLFYSGIDANMPSTPKESFAALK